MNFVAKGGDRYEREEGIGLPRAAGKSRHAGPKAQEGSGKGGKLLRKREFIDQVAAKTGLTKRDSERAMDAVFQIMGELLARRDRMQVNQFGVFETRTRAPRMARNPRTGEAICLPAAIAPVFRPSHALLERLNRSGTETE